MAKVTAKCEFMDNALPAGRLSLKGKFHVAEDDHGELMIFSLDIRNQLCLVMKGAQSHNELINLSDRFGLSKDEGVGSFAVSQNKNGLVHLCFTVRKSGATDRLVVVQPIAASWQDWTRKIDPSKDLYSGEQWNIYVREILLGTSNDSSQQKTSYPQIYLVFKHQGLDTEDIWALTVSTETKSWTNAKVFQMPYNADMIIDKCVANLRQGPVSYRGMFVLYKRAVSDPTQLSFVGFDPTVPNPTLRMIAQKTPKGASLLASMENGRGCTDLLVAGNEFTWHRSGDCYKGATSWTVLSSDAAMSNLSQLHVAQSQGAISIWSLSRAAGLSYQEFDTHDQSPPVSRTPAIPLLSKEDVVDRFAALQNPKLGQKLLVVGEDGSMKALEQSNESGLWMPPMDVTIPQSDEIIEFKSHTILISIAGEQGEPLIKQPVKLQSSISAELIVNGVSLRGSPSGQVIQTDDSGTVTIIIRSDGLASPIITIADPDPSKKTLKDGPVIIDPVSKLWSTVDGIKSADDLKKMTLPDGSSFVTAGADDKDLEKAAQALQDLSKVRQELSSPTNPPASQPPGQVGFADRMWGLWYTIRDQITAGFQWLIRKVGQAWEFVVEIGNQAWSFILTNAPQVAEAMQKVLSTVTKGWEWLKNKFEFFFSWGDILHVKNILVNLTTQGLLWGVDGISLVEMQTNDFFDDLRRKVQQIKAAKLPPEMAKMKAGKNQELEKQAKSERGSSVEEETLNSPGAQYGTYHLKHSGGTLGPRSKDQTSLDRLLIRLQSVLERLEHLTERLKKNLGALFQKKDLTVDEILSSLGFDLLEDVIGVVQSIVTGILGSFSDLLLELVDGINKPITIPVLSPLYKKLTRGSDLTVLDAVALVFAIPGTFLYKIVTGKKPSEIEGIGTLIEPNIMKAELDERMGRVRAEAPPIAPATELFALQAMSFVATPTPGSNHAANSAGGPPAKRLKVINSKGLTEEQVEAIKYNQRRFASSSSTVSTLLKIVIPAGASIWYSCRTWPKLFLTEPYHPMKALLDAGGKLVVWLGQFVSVARYSSDDIKNRRWGIEDRWKEPGFTHRMYIWGVGIFPMIGVMGGNELGYIFGTISGVIQVILLAWQHIESWTVGAGYSIYLAAEEWVKVSAKLVTAISGLTKGGGGYGATAALILNTLGADMSLIRVALEVAEVRDVLCTGMDLEL
ncbi:hypothetical protein NM208_g2329 [Fusarium decemcellulare]|uniref:Uncharacterized protein n=1 Tax=Fusarium decemcellulare TaxID=57161 RepID=A0ACC1ST71_9HYPO|nr:hypothetical protein NM208_g2329 [Fusarium decemcellulare]